MKGCSCEVLFYDRKEHGSYGYLAYQLVQVELVYWNQHKTSRHARARSAYVLDATVYVDGKQTVARYEQLQPPVSRPDAQRLAIALFDELVAAHPFLGIAPVSS